MSTTFQELKDWIDSVSHLTKPKNVYWCDGSNEEFDRIKNQMIQSGEFLALNPNTHPNSVLHRSDPTDVARTEHLTFVCTKNQVDAGPNNYWMEPSQAKDKMNKLYDGCMKDRTMYVIPYVMGPIDSPLSRCGVEITDSAYVVCNMKIMTRMGSAALKRIEREKKYVKGLHSLGDLSPERRFIMHFPEELSIMSIGSGYGGNALLGKKCHALRIGSWQARQEGWLAEHMLIAGIENPKGEVFYIAAAFPSACGKTNLAMLIPPESHKGWKVWTVGDDICWMSLGSDGRLWAINPEAGYFGVAPGTGAKTNPNALSMLNKDTIFTNVGLTKDKQPWWEGLTKEVPEGVLDWQGKSLTSANQVVAHPNARFTVSAKQCPSYTPRAEDSQGVPISAIIFGGRRADTVPLVLESFDWEHGVLLGAGVSSETTAAATGQVGVLRRDPMAMKPFCGYNMGDYWNHWLSFGDRSNKLPKIFHVNWFRQNSEGKFMWPGFGDNLRVIRWIVDRCNNKADAMRTPIGFVPADGGIDTSGLGIGADALQQLLHVDTKKWKEEYKDLQQFFAGFGDRLPSKLKNRLEKIEHSL